MGNSHGRGIIVSKRGGVFVTANVRKTIKVQVPDFSHHRTVTRRDIQLLDESWAFVTEGVGYERSKRSDGRSSSMTTSTSAVGYFYDTFFERLFELAPDTKKLFRSSMVVQGRALIHIVGAIKNILKSPDSIKTAQELAARHVKYGVKLHHFNALGTAMIQTVERCCGEQWTIEMRRAWTHVFVHIVYLMAPVIVAAEKKLKKTERQKKPPRNNVAPTPLQNPHVLAK